MFRVRIRPVHEPALLSRLNALCRRRGLEPARVAGDAAYVSCESEEDACQLVEALARRDLLGRALSCELIHRSTFFDDDGLFADGTADPARRR